MDKGLRTAIWILSSLAVLWTITTVIGWADMSAMMSGGSGRPGDMSGMMSSMMGSGMAMSMMLHMVLTWIVMIGLVGVFIYLVVTARRA